MNILSHSHTKGSQVASFTKWLENFSQVISVDDLILKVEERLSEDFAVSNLSKFCYLYENGVWVLKAPQEISSGVVQADLLLDYQNIGATYLNNCEMLDGLSHFVFEGNDYEILVYYGSGHEATVLIWDYQLWIRNFSIDDIPRLKELLESFANLAGQVSRWLRKIKNVERQLYLDDLTGLYNFKFLDQTLTREIKRAERFEYPFSLLFVDIDDFKKINDTYGHLNGSYVLVQMGEVFKNTLREIDSIYRYGGDEFVVLILGAEAESAMNVAERLRQAVAKYFFQTYTGEEIKLTISIGISVYPDHATEKESLLDIADKNMYVSKKRGKNCSFIRGKEEKKLSL